MLTLMYQKSMLLLFEFGIYDEQLLEFIYGTDGFKPSAKLPFCIPASDEDVEAAYEGLVQR